MYGIDYPEIETDLEYRKKLEDRVQNEGLESLYEKAKKIDSEAMKKISEKFFLCNTKIKKYENKRAINGATKIGMKV